MELKKYMEYLGKDQLTAVISSNQDVYGYGQYQLIVSHEGTESVQCHPHYEEIGG